MLINKWLLTEDITAVAGTNAPAGVCIALKNDMQDRPLFFEAIQKNFVFTPISILLDEKRFEADTEAAFIEDVVSLFFQPSYYTENDRPIVFVSDGSETELRKRIQEKSLAQGMKGLVFKEVLSEVQLATPQKCFNFLLNSSTINFDLVLKEWIDKCIQQKHPAEIHLLVPATNRDAAQIIDGLEQQETNLKLGEQYKLAVFLYEQQQLIEDYRRQLEIKTAEAKNTSLYLSIQKEERANALKWYEKEYEVLPFWYKQFGHIIKVLTGKRTFKSLFQDDVKKLKV